MKKKEQFAWVAGSILLCLLPHVVAAADPPAGRIKLRVTAEQANIRERPDITSTILQQLPEGTILEAERKEGEWYTVLVEKDEGGSILGYVHESLVTVVEAQSEQPPQKEQPEERKAAQEQPIPRAVEETKEVPRYIPPPAQPVSTQGAEEDRLALNFWLGGRYATVGDLNEGAKGLARYYETRLAATGEGDVKSLHFGYLLGAEARLPLAFGFYLSVGAEYGAGESSSSVVYKDSPQEATLATKLKVRAVPISLALVYYPSPSFYLKAGLEYTFGRCGYSYRFSELGPEVEAESWQEWTGEASSSVFGYLAGLGYDWNLASGFSLTAEIIYRHSQLGDLGGEDIYRESSSLESIEKGKLYYFRVDTGTGEAVPLVFVREKRPTEAGVIDVRKAELGLSGLSLKLGIKIRL